MAGTARHHHHGRMISKDLTWTYQWK